ncbi:MAG: TonB-dependent receptor [Flavobacteriaceae bacterium]|nr:TonB-dependent receptor [Flavobacteriaceae bacterium]
MKKNVFSIMLFVTSALIFGQEVERDSTKVENLGEVVLTAVCVKKDAPIAHSNLSKKEISKRNLGQNAPMLLNHMPAVVSYSDDGTGIGYTYMRVRGADATRTNVTINGVPYNDAESQGTYWVNINDLASSTESLQLQRGVGTSTNGASAFGASLNILTDRISEEAFGEISNSFGSYNTLKHTVKLSTGKIDDHFEMSGRISKITSDGYLERASSDLNSYFLQGSYSDYNTIIKALVFGGKEKTYQAWNGIGKDQLKKNRRYNPAGVYTDANGKTQFYDNETDNYWQDHYQLHWNQKINFYWSSHIGLHYTKGKGYYENYKTDRYSEYGLAPLPNNTEGKESKAGLIRRKWLDNDFYGSVFSVNYKDSKWDFIVGGGLNNYVGDHFGTVLWTEKPREFTYKGKYYDNTSKKLDGNIYTKATYKINRKWNLFGDLQYRFVHYKADILKVDDKLNFFNPKAGLTYFINSNSNVYFSYARGHREPNRSDYEANKDVKPEQLNDFELGWRFADNNLNININTYYMLYKDQLVLTGKLDDVGNAFYQMN